MWMEMHQTLIDTWWCPMNTYLVGLWSFRLAGRFQEAHRGRFCQESTHTCCDFFTGVSISLMSSGGRLLRSQWV
jgi:hypothetical protein